MFELLFSRKGLYVIGLSLMGMAVVSVVFQERIAAFADWAGNVASALGLLVSVLGFALTLWTISDTQRINREAQRQIQDAVDKAREETRKAVAGIASQLLANDCATVRHGLQDLRQAAQDAHWPRAVYRCQELRVIALRLARDQLLLPTEATQFRTMAADLSLIQRFVEDNRLPDSTARLQRQHLQRLDEFINVLADIQARLHHASLS